MDMNFASRGVSNTALGLSIGALGLEALGGRNGILGGILGGNNCGCAENMPVNRYELSQQKEITNKDMEIAYLRGKSENREEALEFYKYVDGRFRGVESQLSAQAVTNAQISANISCMQSAIAGLQSLTKTVIPITNVCPQPAVATTTAG